MKKLKKMILMIVLLLSSACADNQEASDSPKETGGIYIFRYDHEIS